MTTDSGLATTAPAVAVGSIRQSAARVFGQYFDDLVLTTFEDVRHDVGERPVSFVGVTAEPGALDTVRWAMTAAEADPSLVVAVEIPEDHGLNHELRQLLAPAADRVRGVQVYDGRSCLVLGGTPAERGSAAWLEAVLDTALAPAIRNRAEQESVARTWEVTAARTRAAEAEKALDRSRSQLSLARGEVKELEGRLDRMRTRALRAEAAAPESDAAPARPAAPAQAAPARAAQPATEPAPGLSPRRLLYAASGVLGAEGRRGRMITLAGLAAGVLVPVVVLAVLLGLTSGAEGVLLGIVLGALVALVGLGVLLAAFTARSLGQMRRDVDDRQQRVGNRVGTIAKKQTDLIERRMAMVEVLLSDQHSMLERLPTAQPLTKTGATGLLKEVGDRMQATTQLFERVPTAGIVPPMSGFAGAPDVLLHLVDVVQRERPSLVVECGSGTSTLFLALTARQHGLPMRIVALEHEREYAAATRALLERHGVSEYAEVRNAPLARTSLSEHAAPWYDESALADLHDIGLLFVDGPPASIGDASRYPAVPLLRDRLAPRCTIVLDDADRPDELAVAESWAPMLEGFSFAHLPLIRGAAVFSR